MNAPATPAAVAPAAPTVTPPEIGTAFEGGFFAGRIQIDGQPYALIVAPRASEQRAPWNSSLTRVDGALDLADGLANTRAMAAAGSDIAAGILASTINGFSDWYIPARDELEVLYRNLKPTDEENWEGDGVNANSIPPGAEYTDDSPAQTTVEAFRDGGAEAFSESWYWSSTQHEASPGRAWDQDFDFGHQNYGRKSYAGRVRAVRRLPI
ncbi:DUF1566 domain-containing protein [Oxalobacteraceae bacterium A2-2]